MSSPNPHAIDADTLSGMKPLRKVVYSIGSNLGDRLGNLQGAVDALSDTPDVIIVDISSVYETEPVGGPEENPKFLNMVVVAETTLEPQTLLERALAIEDAFGRDRDAVKWGPRTLDVDLIPSVTPRWSAPTCKLAAPDGPRAGLRPGALVLDRPAGEIQQGGHRRPARPADASGVVRPTTW